MRPHRSLPSPWCPLLALVLVGCAGPQTVVLDVRNIREPVMLNDLTHVVDRDVAGDEFSEQGLGEVGERDHYMLVYAMIDAAFSAMTPWDDSDDKASSRLDYSSSAEAVLFEWLGHHESRAVLGARVRVRGSVTCAWPFYTEKATSLELSGQVIEGGPDARAVDSPSGSGVHAAEATE